MREICEDKVSDNVVDEVGDTFLDDTQFPEGEPQREHALPLPDWETVENHDHESADESINSSCELTGETCNCVHCRQVRLDAQEIGVNDEDNASAAALNAPTRDASIGGLRPGGRVQPKKGTNKCTRSRKPMTTPKKQAKREATSRQPMTTPKKLVKHKATPKQKMRAKPTTKQAKAKA